ncbi:hypothetical protein [Govanella unica]|uniref:Uncharacterized protein n=1 Tax=Govanella unica TaxID=2975056 RepID=A0A9X3Z6N1_9PROT|nr:hypothetical protein [Govania unica]MDA5193306.1 hypothetical protein [Govania unica]
MIRGLKTGLLLVGCLAAIGGAEAKTATSESGVFALFDRGVLSIVAAHACQSADRTTLQQFTSEFGQVADLVGDELQSMNPGQRRDDLAMLIGFRVAQLELRAETAIKSNGCDAAEVKAMRQLFDLKAQLAMVKTSSITVTH